MALRPAETKGIWQVPAKRFPEFGLFGIVERKQAVVKGFEFFVVFWNVWIGPVGIGSKLPVSASFTVTALAATLLKSC